MGEEYSKADKRILSRLAATEFVGKRAANGIFKDPMSAPLLIGIYELSGVPISSKYCYKEKKLGGEPISLIVREIGPYQDILKLAETHGLNPEALHREIRESWFITTGQDIEKNEKVFRVNGEVSGCLLAALECIATAEDNKPLKALLERSK
jgi:hypothetical protein